jgi:uncharacterized membrane protein YkvA (DUF1232 family)
MSYNRAPAPYNDNIFRSMTRQLRLAWRLFLDPRVSWMAKALPIISALYVISPVDFIPAAVLPLVGGMDDLAIALFGLKMFIEFSPPEVVQEHLRRLTEAVSNWEVVNNPNATPASNPEEVVEGEYSAEDEPAR